MELQLESPLPPVAGVAEQGLPGATLRTPRTRGNRGIEEFDYKNVIRVAENKFAGCLFSGQPWVTNEHCTRTLARIPPKEEFLYPVVQQARSDGAPQLF